MTLLDDLRAASLPTGPACTVSTILNNLPEDDRADLRTALLEAEVKSSTVARVLTGRGHRITAHTIQRHRRGECSCRA